MIKKSLSFDKKPDKDYYPENIFLNQLKISDFTLRSTNNIECCSVLCFGWTVDMLCLHRTGVKINDLRQGYQRTNLYCDNTLWNLFIIY